MKINKVTTKQAERYRDEALTQLKQLGYDTDQILRSCCEHCDCIIESWFDGDEAALAWWQQYNTFNYLAGGSR